MEPMGKAGKAWVAMKPPCFVACGTVYMHVRFATLSDVSKAVGLPKRQELRKPQGRTKDLHVSPDSTSVSYPARQIETRNSEVLLRVGWGGSKGRGGYFVDVSRESFGGMQDLYHQQ